MRLLAYRDGSRVLIGRLFPPDLVSPVAEIADFYGHLDQGLAAALAVRDADRPRAELDEVPAVPPSARVLCVGLNYRNHAAEAGLPIPDRPSIFGRWTASLAATGTPVRVPVDEPGLDWEVELAAVVGRPMHRVDAGAALRGVLGYAAFNDLSARRHQMHSPLWTLGKNADASGPISPIVTADEVGDPAAGWRLTTRVNGTVMQDGSTADMIFSVGEVLAYVSEVLTLHPGDVLITGTPAGVGFKRTPPIYLTAGDEVAVEIDGVGRVVTPVIATDDC